MNPSDTQRRALLRLVPTDNAALGPLDRRIRTAAGDMVTNRKRLHPRLGPIEHITLEVPKTGRHS